MDRNIDLSIIETGRYEISDNVPTFSVGERFSSYKEFESKLNSRLKLTNEKLRIGVGSTKIKGHFGKDKDSPKDDIVYKNIDYVCRHGGIHKSKGHQLRKRKSMKLGCPFRLPLKFNKHLDCLEVVDEPRKLCLEHLHGLPDAKDGFYPEDRRLSTEEAADVLDFMDSSQKFGLKSRQVMKEYVASKFGRSMNTKDITSLCEQLDSIEKKFTCTLCPKVFALKRNHQDHLLTHTDSTSSLDLKEETITAAYPSKHIALSETADNSAVDTLVENLLSEQSSELEQKVNPLIPTSSSSHLPPPGPSPPANTAASPVSNHQLNTAMMAMLEEFAHKQRRRRDDDPDLDCFKGILPFYKKLNDRNKMRLLSKTTSLCMDLAEKQDISDSGT